MFRIDLQLNTDTCYKIMLSLIIFTVCLFLSESTFAAVATSIDTNDVVGDTLCKLTRNLSGPTAKAVSTIAIFMVGVQLFMGKMQWTTAALIAIGIALIFSAEKLITFISGAPAINCI